MSAISGVTSLAAQYIQANNPVKAPPAQPQPAQSSTPAVGNDNDGDNDGSIGNNIDVYA